MDCRNYCSDPESILGQDLVGMPPVVQGHLSSNNGHPGDDNQPSSIWKTCSTIRGEDSCWHVRKYLSCWTAEESKSESCSSRCNQNVSVQSWGPFFFRMTLLNIPMKDSSSSRLSSAERRRKLFNHLLVSCNWKGTFVLKLDIHHSRGRATFTKWLREKKERRVVLSEGQQVTYWALVWQKDNSSRH